MAFEVRILEKREEIVTYLVEASDSVEAEHLAPEAGYVIHQEPAKPVGYEVLSVFPADSREHPFVTIWGMCLVNQADPKKISYRLFSLPEDTEPLPENFAEIAKQLDIDVQENQAITVFPVGPPVQVEL